ncbi:MAG: immune inhibitor A [Bacteroidetes bacterium]|nr:immune inhibitor A [Bacteroidota bacterium]
MRKIYGVFALIVFVTSAFAQQPVFSKLKVFADDAQLLQMMQSGIDVTEGHLKKGAYLISDFSESEIARIEDLGITYEILIEDVSKFYVERNAGKSKKVDDYKGISEWPVPENFDFGSMSGHATYDETVAALEEMTALFPDLITQKESIGQSIEGREIWMVKISDNPNVNETEPEVLYTALHHAREPAGLMTVLYYMWYLLENYDNDPYIQTLVDNTEMYFVPVINPDGYVYNQTTNPNGGGMWRKNRRDNEGTSCDGVDINRNYGYMWGLDNTGSSPDPCDEDYRGTEAFSEPETQAIRNFCEEHEFVNALNYHTHGNLLLYAWGYTEEPSPDDDLFYAHSVLYTQDNNYTFGAGSSTIYPTNGGSDDWMYGEQSAKSKILAYTPELGGGNDGFWCAIDRIIPIAQENMIQNILAAAFAGKYADIEDTSPTVCSDLTGAIDFNFTRLGLTDGGTYMVSLTPLSDEIISVDDPVEFEDPALLETMSESIAFALSPGIFSGMEFKFLLSVDNGDFVISDTISKIFGEAMVLFEDDGNTMTNWISPNWAVTNSSFHSATGSITDSPDGNYPNSHTSAAIMNTDIDLSEAAYAMLTFWAKWEIEQGYDFVQVMISTNNGTTWTALEGKYTVTGNENQIAGQPLYDGFQSEWVQEEIDLTAYIGQTVKFRFFMKTDNWVTEDGFYFDDFQIFVVNGPNTGISQLSNEQVMISEPIPNPSSDLVTFYFSNFSEKEQVKLMIYDPTGQTVFSVPVAQGENSLNISTASWKPGVYFYSLKGRTLNSGAKKLIIL